MIAPEQMCGQLITIELPTGDTEKLGAAWFSPRN